MHLQNNHPCWIVVLETMNDSNYNYLYIATCQVGHLYKWGTCLSGAATLSPEIFVMLKYIIKTWVSGHLRKWELGHYY